MLTTLRTSSGASCNGIHWEYLLYTYSIHESRRASLEIWSFHHDSLLLLILDMEKDLSAARYALLKRWKCRLQVKGSTIKEFPGRDETETR
jgi:hypothetical protein